MTQPDTRYLHGVCGQATTSWMEVVGALGWPDSTLNCTWPVSCSCRNSSVTRRRLTAANALRGGRGTVGEGVWCGAALLSARTSTALAHPRRRVGP